ncbi:hypothetical protein ALC53_08944 [Atta colombica]|uniref:Uncharacterized protein n=1 Tax=Atta colombica TaxID=520822 RepID=A0A151I1U8_9HYME|nr:hypothetical protein ALC53_08944 [Atta colombica]
MIRTSAARVTCKEQQAKRAHPRLSCGRGRNPFVTFPTEITPRISLASKTLPRGESKDAHYLIAAFVISAEDGELLRLGNRCIVKTRVDIDGVNGKGQEMKSTPLYSTRCEGCGGVKDGNRRRRLAIVNASRVKVGGGDGLSSACKYFTLHSSQFSFRLGVSQSHNFASLEAVEHAARDQENFRQKIRHIMFFCSIGLTFRRIIKIF